jgi:hypothetical protein
MLKFESRNLFRLDGMWKKNKVICIEMEYTLRNCEFFGLLETPMLSEISNLGQMITFQTGDYVFCL